MTEPITVKPGELTEDELIETIQDGRRVIITVETAGGEHTVTLRWDGETYFCDTPTRLHRHDEEAEMRTCLSKNGYTSESQKAE